METIWAKNIRNQKNHTLAFYFCGTILEGSYLNIAASNIYRLFIDGVFAGYGPARAAHNYIREDQYDLSRYSNQKIHIVIEVYASNVNSYYIVDELPFFSAGIVCGSNEVVSTSDFKAYSLHDRVQKVQRYSFQRPFVESYVMSHSRSSFYLGDTSLFLELETEAVPGNIVLSRNVPYPNLKPIPFAAEIEYGRVAINKQNEKWENRSLSFIGEQLKGFHKDELHECLSDEACEFDYQALGETSKDAVIKSGEYRLYRFERNLTGFFCLKLNVIKRTTLYLLWDEILWDEKSSGRTEKLVCFHRGSCCNVIKYVLEPGEYELLSFEPYTAQYAKLIVTDGQAEVYDFSIVLYENSSGYKLRFHCCDSALDKIVAAAAHTLAQNSVDILTDSPSRERAGWLCDSYFCSRTETLFTGQNLVEQNFLENFILAPKLKQLPEGMIPSCYTADHYDGVFIPNWSMWYVLELSSYYKRTKDRRLIEKSRQKVYALVDYFSRFLNSDGLLEDLECWIFVEWSMANNKDFVRGVNYPTNMLYCGMLDAVDELYGDRELKQQSAQMKKTIVRQSFNGEFFEDNRVREHSQMDYTEYIGLFHKPEGYTRKGKLITLHNTTETCQYYAFYFGIATRQTHPQLFDTMMHHFGAGRDEAAVYPKVYKSNALMGNYLRIELLLRYGYRKKAVEECKAFFGGMAERTNTLWEHSYVSGSCNNGFASIAGNYVIEAITGFEGADIKNKTITVHKEFLDINTEISIPVLNQTLYINIKDGKREIIAPSGYVITQI